MIKIWNEAFLKKQPDTKSKKNKISLNFYELLPSILLGIASISLGLFASWFFDITLEAANQLIVPNQYIETVLQPLK